MKTTKNTVLYYMGVISMKLDMDLHDIVVCEAQAAGHLLGPHLLEAVGILEQLAESGAQIGVYENRGCTYPTFNVPLTSINTKTAGMLYGLLLLSWPFISPEPDERCEVRAVVSAADFLPKAREIMQDGQKVAALLGLG